VSGGKLDVAWILASFLAMALSIVFLVFLDKPDIQIAITA
jgi:hypothetical protein